MTEKIYGDIIEKYPELIEEGLTFIDREVNVNNRRIDLLFEDVNNRQLIVELKIVPINDTHVGQIIAYYASLADKSPRIMLISTNVPLLIRNTLDTIGIGWKEITVEKIIKHLREYNDNYYINLILGDRQMSKEAGKIKTPFENEIEHLGNGSSIIRFFDRFNRTLRNFNVTVPESIASIYFTIEKRLFERHPNYIVWTYNNDEVSWGFANGYQGQYAGENLASFMKRTIWVHFTGRGNNRIMQIEIHNSLITYFDNSRIPREPRNFQTWNPRVGPFLIIRDYINEDTIDEIMDILVKIIL